MKKFDKILFKFESARRDYATIGGWKNYLRFVWYHWRYNSQKVPKAASCQKA